MRIQTVVLFILIPLGIAFLWQNQGSGDECRLPVSYTTGDELQDKRLYEAEGWELIEVIPALQNGFQVGWIGKIEIFGEDDPRIETLVADPHDRAQILDGDRWLLQEDLEHELCEAAKIRTASTK